MQKTTPVRKALAPRGSHAEDLDAHSVMDERYALVQSRAFEALRDDGSTLGAIRTVAAAVEEALPGVLCRIVIVNQGSHTVAALREPAWPQGFENPELAPLNDCAVAAESQVMADFREQGRWPRHAVGALLAGLKSCVIEPFQAGENQAAAIAIYTTGILQPDAYGIGFLRAVARLLTMISSVCGKNEKDQADAARFRSLSKSIPGVVYQRLVTTDGDIRYTYISDSAAELFGVDAERIINDPEALFQHYDDEYRESFRKKLIEASRGMQSWDVEAKIVRPDGQVRYTHAIARPKKLADGSVLWTGVILDADRIKKAELAAADAEAQTRKSIVDSMSQGMALFDKEDRLVVANKFFRELYPMLEKTTAPGTTFEAFVRAEYEHLPIARRGTDQATMTQRLQMRDTGGFIAERRLAEDRWILVNEHRTSEGGTVVLHTDVSELKVRERRIHHLAFHDVLTGLPNRASFRQKLVDEMARCKKSGDAIAVLCLDLDGFKYVNDTLGHPTGDELLVEVSKRIMDNLRDTDTAARLGGDEFAIIVSEKASIDTVTGIAWRLLNALAEPVDIRGQRVVTTTSIGVAFVAANESADPDALMKHADLALYRSKADGRNTFRFFESEMDAIAQRRRQLENDLRMAVERDELELFFQPLVDVYTEEVMGAEALVRWRHPQRGLISPLDFIALAEETGIIIKIGAWVIRRACEEAVNWSKPIRVAVNVSPAQFKDRDLISRVKDVLATTGLDPSRLEFEVTESLLLRDTAANLQLLNELKSLGVRISMDDFGTGYSSLGNLRSFPFDKIKIDRSFVSDLENSPDSAAIVRAVLSLGRGLGMTTTAEGVETSDQLAYLRAEGCVEVQGFYFSEPRPAAEVAQMLRTGFPRPANVQR